MNELIEILKQKTAEFKSRVDGFASIAIDCTIYSTGEPRLDWIVMSRDRNAKGETFEEAMAEWEAMKPELKMVKEAASLEARAAELRAKAAELQKEAK